MKSLYTVCTCAALLAACSVATAEIIGPGDYNGHYNQTRWGHQVFHAGPYHVFVSDKAAKRLSHKQGEPLKIKVTDISQPINPGAGRIESVCHITTANAFPGLNVSAALSTTNATPGQGMIIDFTLRNTSKETITINSGDLALVTTSQSCDESRIDYQGVDNIAYWYYSYGYTSLKKPHAHKAISCHQTILLWDGKTFWDGGQRYASPGRDRRHNITINAGQKLTASYTFGKELPEGEYEAYIYITTGNLSHVAGPMSKRLPFDIVLPSSKAELKRP